MIRKTRNILAVLLFSFQIAFAVKTETEHFTLQFSPEDSRLAETVKEKILSFLPRISSVLDLREIPKFQIIIASSSDEWNRLTRGSLPEWVEAVTINHSRTIILKSPRFSRRNMNDFTTTLLHEAVHIAIGSRAPVFRIPRWLNEGLAILITNDMSLSDKIILSKAANSNNILDFHKIESMLSLPREKAQLAYAEAASAVYFLTEIFGMDIIPELLNAVRRDIPFSKVFQSVTGITLIRFQLLWRDNIGKKYKWLLFIQTDTLLWLMFPLLLILAYISVRLRNRKIHARWKTEEDEEEFMKEVSNSNRSGTLNGFDS